MTTRPACTGIICASLILVSCSAAVQPRSEAVLGTACTVNAFSDGTAGLYDELFARLAQIDDAFSVNKDTSEVSAVNRAAGRNAVHVSADVMYVAETALHYADVSGGAFDPAIGPLVKLWGINTDHARVPSQAEIDSVLPLVNWRDVAAVPDSTDLHHGGTLFLRHEGMALDFGGIAKGYAADELVKILRAHHVKRAVIDLGGNIYVYGKKKDGSPWHVGIKDPDNPEGDPITVLDVEPDSTVVTSGIYERFFIRNGILYHHILDPETGYPAASGRKSVTIVGHSSIQADALSTSVFIMEKQQGEKLAENEKVKLICY
jgi:thiamine biosynthesis lipoprotein